MGAGDALLLKVNQVRTLTEALDAAYRAFRHRYGVQVSERSGQTEDKWLADMVVALNAGQIKTGAAVGARELPSTTSFSELKRNSVTWLGTLEGPS